MKPTNILEIPGHLLKNGDKLASLQLFANHMGGRYGAPVYLCGSSVFENNVAPRDWDITIWLPDEDFERMYQPVIEWEQDNGSGIPWSHEHWNWADDCLKQTKWGWEAVRLNIDFKVMPASFAKKVYDNKPHVRLDTKES